MSFYWVKTNQLIKKIFGNYYWDLPNQIKSIYLTFDDGPTPEITDWVLDLLKDQNIKATFFCIGKNIQANPLLFERIKKEGHSIGNHTFNHVNGWKTKNKQYINNVEICECLLDNKNNVSKLFRPPYGKLTRSQSKILRNKGYKIIMWDVLSADFDTTIAPEQCLNNVISTVQSGSIIVFHDSVKAATNMQHALPKVIRFLKDNGYTFGTIPK
ncbi:polysaccharide deacetylase family protein [Flavobacterium sp. TMP13]|uniref:polysaccharide deacetylase family protein n=1 Tax=Flavobacterium sp. TMP13 TaxID=3425950 RepID=UPI003D770543